MSEGRVSISWWLKCSQVRRGGSSEKPGEQLERCSAEHAAALGSKCFTRTRQTKLRINCKSLDAIRSQGWRGFSSSFTLTFAFLSAGPVTTRTMQPPHLRGQLLVRAAPSLSPTASSIFRPIHLQSTEEGALLSASGAGSDSLTYHYSRNALCKHQVRSMV